MSDLRFTDPAGLRQPGWYVDPDGGTRWWSGREWTEQVAASTGPASLSAGTANASAGTPDDPPDISVGMEILRLADLRSQRNKARVMVAGGVGALAVGLVSYLNAEANGGLIWIGGFLLGLSLVTRGSTLLFRVHTAGGDPPLTRRAVRIVASVLVAVVAVWAAVVWLIPHISAGHGTTSSAGSSDSPGAHPAKPSPTPAVVALSVRTTQNPKGTTTVAAHGFGNRQSQPIRLQGMLVYGHLRVDGTFEDRDAVTFYLVRTGFPVDPATDVLGDEPAGVGGGLVMDLAGPGDYTLVVRTAGPWSISLTTW